MKIAMTMTVLLCACGKGENSGGEARSGATKPGACPPLEVLVDGKKVEGLGHPVAIVAENSGYKTPMVKLYNHDKMTCEKAITGQDMGTEGELVVRAWSGAAPGVGIETWTQLGMGDTVRVDAATEKAGETMTLCVPKPVVFTPNVGAYAGKQVSIVGTFSAPFCGVWKS